MNADLLYEEVAGLLQQNDEPRRGVVISGVGPHQADGVHQGADLTSDLGKLCALHVLEETLEGLQIGADVPRLFQRWQREDALTLASKIRQLNRKEMAFASTTCADILLHAGESWGVAALRCFQQRHHLIRFRGLQLRVDALQICISARRNKVGIAIFIVSHFEKTIPPDSIANSVDISEVHTVLNECQ